jgi:hypothetical protein
VDAQNGEMVFTTEPPSGPLDGEETVEEAEAELAAVARETEDDGSTPVSPADQDRLENMMND